MCSFHSVMVLFQDDSVVEGTNTLIKYCVARICAWYDCAFSSVSFTVWSVRQQLDIGISMCAYICCCFHFSCGDYCNGELWAIWKTNQMSTYWMCSMLSCHSQRFVWMWNHPHVSFFKKEEDKIPYISIPYAFS